MREIKFRAWDKRNNCWYAPGTGFEIHWLGGIVTHEDGESKAWGGDIPFEVMQYTGLNDKNGKEIYEGDIVNDCSQHWEDGNTKLHDKTGVVVYSIFETRFHAADEYDGKWVRNKCHDGWFSLGDHVEVIGNIYESPDLLK